MSDFLAVRNVGAVELAIVPSALALKVKALEDARGLTAVSDPFMQQVAVDTMADMKRLLSNLEKSRKVAKEPILDAGKKLDALAASYAAELEAEYRRIGKLVSAFEEKRLAEERRIEAERQAEIRRIEEQQRKEREEEGRKTREAEAAARREKNEQERSRLDEEAAERRRQTTLAEETRQRQLAAVPKAETTKPQGAIVREVWRYEVLNVHALARNRPLLVKVEASASAIQEAIRGGMRDCPGLRIWKETDVGARAA